MTKTKLYLCCCLCFCFGQNAISQSGLDKAITLYRDQIGNQLGIFNGPIYNRATNIQSGHPFFLTDTALQGSVYFENFLYTNIPLMLDETEDKLITHDYGRQNLVELVKSKVDSFSIGEARFINRKGENGGIYYQQLYAAKSEVLIKEVKRITKKLVGLDETQLTVESQRRYFVVIGGKLTRISNKREFLKLFDQRRNEIRNYLNEQSVRFKKNPEQYLVMGVSRYDELSK